MEIRIASKMASCSCWLDKNGALLDYTDTAPAPCKDFYHVFVTPTQIIFRFWKIVPPTRPDSKMLPSETIDTYDDFLQDERLHSEIQRLAGDNTLQHLIRIAKGQIDYFPRLPDNVLLKIFSMLDLEDLQRLGCCTRHFKDLAVSDQLWEKIYHCHCETPITEELCDLAKQQGWRRLFFTNKLQLQMQLRRQKRHEQHDHHDQYGMEQLSMDEQQQRV